MTSQRSQLRLQISAMKAGEVFIKDAPDLRLLHKRILAHAYRDGVRLRVRKTNGQGLKVERL